jgi:hypothetical protein
LKVRWTMLLTCLVAHSFCLSFFVSL